ncbi:hypothetical protein SDC9_197038 [bioreactor metagenome]|uniref:Uncharacterized protein n=1 Tax=bioreactor metagenome TaxID=1076179 RepID=A0A645IDU1_9ZZZZ
MFGLHPVGRIRLDDNLLNPAIIGIVINIIGACCNGNCLIYLIKRHPHGLRFFPVDMQGKTCSLTKPIDIDIGKMRITICLHNKLIGRLLECLIAFPASVLQIVSETG